MTAARWAKRGAKVVIADVDGPGAEETGAYVKRTGGEAELVIGDISTMDGAGASSTAPSNGSEHDILVNNTGISQREAVDTWNCAEEMGRILQVDLKSVFVCTKAALPIMLEQGHGAVVSLASIAASCRSAEPRTRPEGRHRELHASRRAGDRRRVGFASIACRPASCARRCGLRGAVRPLSRGTGRSHCRDGCVGAVKRAGSPIDIAEAELFLASEEAGYITGQELVVDGGYLVR